MKKTHLRKTTPLSLLTGAYFSRSGLAYSGQGLLILFSICPAALQLKHILAGSAYQFSRNKKESFPDCLNHIFYLLLVQYLLLKEVHKIVSKHQQFKPAAVSSVVMRDRLVEAKTIYLLFYEVFAACPLVIIPPEILGFPFAVGQYYLVIIADICCVKEFELCFLGELFFFTLCLMTTILRLQCFVNTYSHWPAWSPAPIGIQSLIWRIFFCTQDCIGTTM